MRWMALFALVCACDAQGAIGDDGSEGEPAEVPLSTHCDAARVVVCPGSPNNCRYPADDCDPLPRALDRVSRTPLFPLAGSGHVLEDSEGNVLGVVTDASVHLNWGQRRSDIHGTSKVLAFAAHTTAGAFSGWIDESAIARDLSWMPSAHAPDPGGTYSTWHVIASDDTPYRDANGDSLKVIPKCAPGGNATDYMGRNGHVNLIYNLPASDPALGSGTIDSYPNTTSYVFRRAEVQLSIERPLYSCASGSPVRVGQTLRFLYGYIDPHASRHGWIAMPNLAPGL
jgi:hypothetical protein